MQTVGESLRTSNDLQVKRLASTLDRLIQELKPQDPASPAMLKAVNNALKEISVPGEVKQMTRGEYWQFQDVYKYAYQCEWECLNYRTCKFKGLSAIVSVVDNRLKYEYVGCGRFLAFRRLVEWARSEKNSEALKAMRTRLRKEPEELTMDEWKIITEHKFDYIISGR